MLNSNKSKKPVTEGYLQQQFSLFKRELKSELKEDLGFEPYESLTETHLADQLLNLKLDIKDELQDCFRLLNHSYNRNVHEHMEEIKSTLSDTIIRENRELQNRVQTLEERIGYLENEREFYASHNKGRRKKFEREVIDIVNDVVSSQQSLDIISQKSDDVDIEEDHSPSSKKKEMLMRIANSRFCTDNLRNKLSKLSRKHS